MERPYSTLKTPYMVIGEEVISGKYGYGVVLDINTCNAFNVYKVSFDRYGTNWVCSLTFVHHEINKNKPLLFEKNQV